MILALETVFEQCSVALLTYQTSPSQTLPSQTLPSQKLNATALSPQNTDLGQPTILAEQTLLGSRMQTQQILPMIAEILATTTGDFSKLTAIAFNRGPGAFSGIRINTAVAQALSFAHDVPCVPISSLQAIAQHAFITHKLTHVFAAIDARMNQVYFGEFALVAGQMTVIGEEKMLNYGESCKKNLPLVGNGAVLLNALSHQTIFADVVPTAATLGRLALYKIQQGDTVTAENALPVYLRNHAWKTLAEQGKA